MSDHWRQAPTTPSDVRVRSCLPSFPPTPTALAPATPVQSCATRAESSVPALLPAAAPHLGVVGPRVTGQYPWGSLSSSYGLLHEVWLVFE